MKILWLIPVIIVMFAGICYSIERPREKTQEKLLRSNFAETPYTAWVKIVDVQKKGSELLYPTYLFICDIQETFKGEKLHRIEYLRGFEDPFKKPVIEIFGGKSFIVSLLKNDKGQYYMGDNGYALDDSLPLLTVARKLSKDSEHGAMNVSGKWYDGQGTVVVFEQSGENITGKEIRSDKISSTGNGTLKGRNLVLNYTSTDSGVIGKTYFIVSEDGKQMTGTSSNSVTRQPMKVSLHR